MGGHTVTSSHTNSQAPSPLRGPGISPPRSTLLSNHRTGHEDSGTSRAGHGHGVGGQLLHSQRAPGRRNSKGPGRRSHRDTPSAGRGQASTWLKLSLSREDRKGPPPRAQPPPCLSPDPPAPSRRHRGGEQWTHFPGPSRDRRGWGLAPCAPTLACLVGITLDLAGDLVSVSSPDLGPTEACEKPTSTVGLGTESWGDRHLLPAGTAAALRLMSPQ